MTVSVMHTCLWAGAGPESDVGVVRGWLRDRMRWEDRVRMIGEAAALHGGPIEMHDETPSPELPQTEEPAEPR